MVGADTRCPTTLSRLATTEDFSVVQLDTVEKGTTITTQQLVLQKTT